MVVGRQDLGVGLPLVGVVEAVVSVASRERGPQALRGSGPPTAQHPGHDAARSPFDRQPQPDFALAPPDEGPQLIQFQGFRFPALGLFLSGDAATGARPAPLFFISLTMIIRATPVAHTMLRWELRSVSKASTWAYCAALATAAGTNRAWHPHAMHWYFGWLPCVPLRRMCSLPQRAHKCCV